MHYVDVLYSNIYLVFFDATLIVALEAPVSRHWQREGAKQQGDIDRSHHEYGKHHSNTISTLAVLTTSFLASQQYLEAIKNRDEVLRLCQRVHGPTAPATVDVMMQLATIQACQKDFAAALATQQEVVDTRHRTVGDVSVDVLSAQHNLALLLACNAKLHEAVEMQSSVIRDLDRRSEQDGHDGHERMAAAQVNLPGLMQLMGRHWDGLTMMKVSQQYCFRFLDSTHPFTYFAGRCAVELLSLLGEKEDCIRLQRRIACELARVRGAGDLETLRVLCDLADYLACNHEPRQARAVVQEFRDALPSLLDAGVMDSEEVETAERMALRMQKVSDHLMAHDRLWWVRRIGPRWFLLNPRCWRIKTPCLESGRWW